MRATFVFILAAACSLVTAYPAARALSSTTPRVLSESPNASFGTTHQPRTHDGHIPAAERKGKILLSNSGMGSPPHDSTLRPTAPAFPAPPAASSSSSGTANTSVTLVPRPAATQANVEKAGAARTKKKGRKGKKSRKPKVAQA